MELGKDASQILFSQTLSQTDLYKGWNVPLQKSHSEGSSTRCLEDLSIHHSTLCSLQHESIDACSAHICSGLVLQSVISE